MPPTPPDQHESVETVRARQQQPVTLDECFRAFVREEQLMDEDQWYCPTCKVSIHTLPICFI